MSKLSFQEELDRLIKISEEELLSDSEDGKEDGSEDEDDTETEDAESEDNENKLASFNKLATLAKRIKSIAKSEDSITYSDLNSYVRSLGNGRN